MKLKLITLAYDSQTGAFPAEPLDDIDGEILSVVEHFFHDNGQPRLLLIVHYRPLREAREAQAARGLQQSGVRTELSQDEQPLFDRLRTWRNGRAQADGVPPYVLLTNRQVAEIARRRPGTMTALCEIPGIGDQKSGRFGREILAVIAQAAAAPTPQAAPSAPPEVCA